MNVFCRRPGRISTAASSSKIGSADKSRNPVEVNPTPPASAVSHFYLGTGRHLADHAESRAGARAHSGLVSRRQRGCVRKPGCDETGAEHDACPSAHFFLSIAVIFFLSRTVTRGDVLLRRRERG
jgi:hypothetical protein